ncbi:MULTISPECIES: hypothetical protein [Neisseria]|nr:MULTISPECIES: hypothetical protein [Neisseria]
MPSEKDGYSRFFDEVWGSFAGQGILRVNLPYNHAGIKFKFE